MTPETRERPQPPAGNAPISPPSVEFDEVLFAFDDQVALDRVIFRLATDSVLFLWHVNDMAERDLLRLRAHCRHGE